jgi:transcription elongation factor Elf1
MSEQTQEKAKTYKCSACGHVQARGKVYRKGWGKCRPCDSCGATSWIPQGPNPVKK